MKDVLVSMFVDHWLPTVGGLLFLLAGVAYLIEKPEAAIAIGVMAGALTGITAASAGRK